MVDVLPEVGQDLSAVAHLLAPELHASSSAGGAAALSIMERRNMVQLQLIARQDRAAELADIVAQFLGLPSRLAALHGGQRGGLFVFATAPSEYWVLGDKETSCEAIAELLALIGDTASIFDQSGGRFVIQLAGPGAIHVLAKGTSLDLHDGVFPSPGASHGEIDHMPALILRGPTSDCFQVSVPRSYASSFITWLGAAAREYGLVVQTK